ncbi:hypothetical protein HPB50_016056 [Hyalomma asiaticum]|uniref:Uncharacterized protein n=1 Tax=Hyalomma asiaticum TaxID=266040 RepID=A0ACB7RXS8_HYAAI|nr:hypothetical protein HPB50_016056 [Hyalomma asiaticum]
MTASCGGESEAGSLFVVDIPGPALCARDIIRAFNQSGEAMLNPKVVCMIHAQPDKALQTLLDEFKDVFAPRLGKFTGPQVKYQQKEQATPGFYLVFVRHVAMCCFYGVIQWVYVNDPPRRCSRCLVQCPSFNFLDDTVPPFGPASSFVDVSTAC